MKSQDSSQSQPSAETGPVARPGPEAEPSAVFPPLVDVLAFLYAHEINCGLSSFWDGGFDVWIGDAANGIRAQTTYDVDDLAHVGLWLAETAGVLYPILEPPWPVYPAREFRPDHTKRSRRRARLTLLQATGRAPEALEQALAAVDAADKACPVRASGSDPDRCPKCGATSSQNCGPEVTALAKLADGVRAALSTKAPTPDGSAVGVASGQLREEP